MISVEKHIPPQVRRELCGRLLYFDSVQPLKDNSYDANAALALDALRNALFEVYIKEELSDLDLPPNGSFLARLVSRLARAAEPQLEHHPELLRSLKSVLHETIAGTSCLNCNSINSDLALEEAVGVNGCFMASLRKMFDAASQTAIKYYSEFTTVRPSTFPTIVFCTKHVRDRTSLHELPISYSITGSTELCAQSKQYWSEVSVKLCVPDFDFDSYMSIPYVLFHECIVHAFQGVVPNCDNRAPSEPEDGFCEGWMDYVALKIMDEVVAGEGPTADFGLNGIITKEHQLRASNFHLSRINLEVAAPYKPSPYACHRKAGNEVADRVLHVLQKLPKSRRVAWATFLQMSLNLNLLQTFTPTQRKKFVGVLTNLGKRGNPESVRHCEIVSIINQYLRHQDISRLVKEILALTDVWMPRRPISGPLPPRPPLITRRFQGEIH